MLAATGSARDLLNFDALTTKTPSTQSISPRSKRMASPTRMPVTASRPITARTVAARSGVGMVPAWAINASMSSWE